MALDSPASWLPVPRPTLQVEHDGIDEDPKGLLDLRREAEASGSLQRNESVEDATHVAGSVDRLRSSEDVATEHGEEDFESLLARGLDLRGTARDPPRSPVHRAPVSQGKYVEGLTLPVDIHDDAIIADPHFVRLHRAEPGEEPTRVLRCGA